MNRIRILALGALAAAVVAAPLSAQARPDSTRRGAAAGQRRGGQHGQPGQPGQRGARGEFGARGMRQGMGQGMGQQLGRSLFRGIQLTEQEKASLKAIRTKYQPQLQSLRSQLQPQMQAAMAARRSGDTTAARAAWNKTTAQRDQLKALAQQMRDETRNALTPEHRAQFDRNVAQTQQRVKNAAQRGRAGRDFRGERGGRGARGARAARGPQGFGPRLELSDAEKAKVQAIRAKYQPQFQALRQQAQGDRAKAQQQGRTLREQMQAEVRAALTPAHQQQLDSLKTRRGAKARPNG